MSVAERKRSVRDRGRGDRRRAGTIMSCSDQNLDVVLDLARHAAGDRLGLHRGARAGAALSAQAGRDALRVLPHDQRAGGHRHRAVEPSGLRLPDEPGAVRADRRTAERGGDQVQRAARDVCAADAARRRQDPGQHGVGGGVVRQHRRARLAALSLLVAALHCCRPRSTAACANTPISRSAARSRAPRRCATASIRCARRSAARARRRNSTSHSKYWQELLGQAGGAVRRPMLALTEAEKEATRRAFESCGLKLDRVRSARRRSSRRPYRPDRR